MIRSSSIVAGMIAGKFFFFMVLRCLYLIFCFAVLCAKNLAKKDFFSKYALIV